jgi:hypothetical protein
MIAHYEATKISAFHNTHPAHFPRPDYVYAAIVNTFRICLGMLCLRKLGTYPVNHAGDFGILWPFMVASSRLLSRDFEEFFHQFLEDWPEEYILVNTLEPS